MARTAAAADGNQNTQYSPKMLPFLRALFNGVHQEQIATENAAVFNGDVPTDARVCIPRQKITNEMWRRIKDAGPVSIGAIDQFLCLGNAVPTDHRVEAPFSRENPLPPEIFTEERIDQFKSLAVAQKVLHQTGLPKKVSDAAEKLKTMVRPWWDSETDGDEEGTSYVASSETEDDKAAA